MRKVHFSFPILAALVAAAPSTGQASQASGLQGIDVSHYQASVNWNTMATSGVVFAYIKATEGSGITHSTFSSKYAGAASAGIYRGAYHLAHPDQTSGAAQAKFFVANGGHWTPTDGLTLPGALDLESNPNGPACYGLNATEMTSWILDFLETYANAVNNSPVIYTSTSWWTQCTGNYGGFWMWRLWLARYGSTIGALPGWWSHAKIWQYADSGPYPGDQDLFNGTLADLKFMATTYAQ